MFSNIYTVIVSVFILVLVGNLFFYSFVLLFQKYEGIFDFFYSNSRRTLPRIYLLDRKKYYLNNFLGKKLKKGDFLKKERLSLVLSINNTSMNLFWVELKSSFFIGAVIVVLLLVFEGINQLCNLF
ncbi:MAG TPA: hypothetical protein DHW82_05455 [Spirochaetia bacterium]|nr:MAG: hypothetical protein A2Y41_09045 [Spirochaetes bacterium GWB1_36_13]HCL56439.1 hypothetical protein [Spirochaetia bacterium]